MLPGTADHHHPLPPDRREQEVGGDGKIIASRHHHQDLHHHHDHPPASVMETGLTKEMSVCLAGMVALSLPLDDQALGQWNLQLLRHVVDLLGLKPDHVEALRPLIHAEGNDTTIRRLQMDAFMRGFTPSDDSAGAKGIRAQEEQYQKVRYRALRNVVVLLASKSVYDARSRMVVRRLAESMHVPWYMVGRIEALTASDLHDIWEASKAKDKVHRGWRLAKIGAAAAAGGTILALTGGLAAPAISVGLAAMGSTSAAVAATYATTTTVATLFGASGAGLVGYKVGRRTKGVTHFELKKQGTDEDPAKMVICICISGWLVEDESEFQVPWGAEPDPEYLAARLRLFYKMYNPDNIKKASILSLEYEGRTAELAKACKERYGASPFDRLTPPSPPNPLTTVPEDEKAEVAAMLQLQRPEGTRRRRRGRKGKGGEEGGCCEEEEEEEGGAEGLLHSIIDMASPVVSRESSAPSPTPPPPPPAPPSSASSSQSPSPSRSHSSTAASSSRPALLSPKSKFTEEAVMEEDGDEGGKAEGGGGGVLKVEQGDDENDKSGSSLLDEEVKEVPLPWFHDELPFYDQYTLHWEPSILINLGHSVMELVASVGQQAALEVLSYTVAATLVSALAWPITLVQAADYIDGTWTVCCDRADRAGKLLAEVLMKREHGSRPVVLIGYSMGARMIMSCLLELVRVQKAWEAEQQQAEEGSGRGERGASVGSPAVGLVHTAIMMGTPLSCDESAWASLKSVVSDRVINVYSKRDWILAVLYRYNKLALGVCGVRAINVPGVQNVDASKIIGGHQEYATKTRDVLRLCGLEDSLSRYRFRRGDQQQPPSRQPGSAATTASGAGGQASSSSSIINEYFGGGGGGGGAQSSSSSSSLLQSALQKLSVGIQKLGEALEEEDEEEDDDDEGGEGQEGGEEQGQQSATGREGKGGDGDEDLSTVLF